MSMESSVIQKKHLFREGYDATTNKQSQPIEPFLLFSTCGGWYFLTKKGNLSVAHFSVGQGCL